jgi:hypothetical protein
MRRIALLLIPLCLTGCSSLNPFDPNKIGWNVSVGTPGVVATPVVVQPTSGSVAAMALGAGPLGAAAAPTLAQLSAAGPCGPVAAPAPSLPMPRLAATSGCTLEDVCQKLDNIDRRISTLETAKPALKMP